MTTKLLMVALSMVAGTMGGLILSKRLSRRAEYFDALLNLNNLIISEVKFRKSTTKAILSEFVKTSNSPLNSTLNEYILCGDISKLTISKGVLTKAEAAEIKKFLLSLGTADSVTQIFELENYKVKFIQMKEAAFEKRKKYGGMYVKLGFLLGIAIGIIII